MTDLSQTRLDIDHVSVVYPMKRVSGQRMLSLNALREEGLGSEIAEDRSRGIVALSDIDLRLKPGDRLGIFGRNGCGKSTLLKVMAGLHPPTKGTVISVGRSSALFNVGIGVKAEATGVENIILGGIIRGLTRSEAEAKIEEIAEFSGLGDYLLLPVRTYSRGMAMRLAFSTATTFNPEILILDEWIGAGDKAFRDKAEKRMRGLVDGAGIVVLASHRIGLIKNVCNQFLWLQNGKLVEYSNDPSCVDRFENMMKAVQ